MKPLASHALPSDITSALLDFIPHVASLSSEHALDGDLPVVTPQIGDVKCVACVYADPHRDLPYPRFSALAPITVRENAVLSVRDPSGAVHTKVMKPGELIILDSHSEHWVDKPHDYPHNWDSLSTEDKHAYKSKNMIVFANMDFDVYPSVAQCEEKFRRLLYLPTPKKKGFAR